MNANRLKKLVYMSMFIALEVVLTRFLSIQTPIVRIGLTFLPIALSAMMFGPVFSGVAAALADLLGMLLFSSGAAYFPGFTLTAFLSGLIYGWLLYRKPKTLLSVSLAAAIVVFVLNLGLDTIWLWMLTGKGLLLLLPARAIKSLVMLPIQVVLIRLVWRSGIERLIPKPAGAASTIQP